MLASLAWAPMSMHWFREIWLLVTWLPVQEAEVGYWKRVAVVVVSPETVVVRRVRERRRVAWNTLESILND